MKTILITGASGGIGLAAAKRFCDDGYAVIAGYNNNSAYLQDIATAYNENGGVMQPVKIDVRSDNSCENAIRYITDTFGKLDCLVNCAGISEISLLEESKLWQDIIDINLSGTIRMCRAALPALICAQGCIINISSVWGNAGASCECAYSAAKGGINAFTRSLAKEMGAMDVRVNAVAPGYIDTKMNNSLSPAEVKQIVDDIPMNRLGTPEEIAKIISFLASENSSYMTGQIITADGGWTV